LRERVAPEKEDSLLQAKSNEKPFRFHHLIRRQVQGHFHGGAITTDAGGLLLREVEKQTAIIERFAACLR